MNKYINFFNDEFVYNEQKSLDNTDLYLTLPTWKFTKYIYPMNSVIRITEVDKVYNVAYFEIRSSGIPDNNNKRIQIQQKLFSRENLMENNLINNLMTIGVYYAGNKCCYVRFGIKPIINDNDSSKSVWVNFNQIVYCIRNEEKIKYKTTDKVLGTDYLIYLSCNFEDLLQINESNFKEVKTSEINRIDLEINKFKLNFLIKDLKKTYAMNENFEDTDDLDCSVFSSSTDDFNSNSHYIYHNENAAIGRKAEEHFNHLLINNPEYVKKELKVNKIYSVDWVNKSSESYKPYDFCINDHIFIDVKGTYEEVPYFEISNNEMNFRKRQKEEGNKYFIVNVTNVFKKFNHEPKLIFYDDDKIEDLQFKEKIKFVYEG